MNRRSHVLSVPVAALLLASGGAAWALEAQPAPVPAARAQHAQLPEEAVCAICGVREKAGPEPVAASPRYQGNTYYFCREACKTEFQQDPGKWIMAAQASGQEREGVTPPAPKPASEAGHSHGPAGVGPAGGAGGGSTAPS